MASLHLSDGIPTSPDWDDRMAIEAAEHALRNSLGSGDCPESCAFDGNARLGAGRYGSVYRRDGDSVVKVVRLGEMEAVGRVAALTEVWVLRRVAGGHIPRLLSHCIRHTPHGEELLICMEMLDHSLRDGIAQRRGPYALSEVVSVARGLASAVASLHAMRPHPVIHHDVKSSNVMFTSDGRLILCDLGLAELVTDDAISYHTPTSPRPGTLRWKAPELETPEKWSQMPLDARLKSDVWSIGAVLVEMLALEVPFSELEFLWLVKSAWSDRKPPVVARRGDPEFAPLVEIVDSCINYDLAARPSAEELLEMIEALDSGEHM